MSVKTCSKGRYRVCERRKQLVPFLKRKTIFWRSSNQEKSCGQEARAMNMESYTMKNIGNMFVYSGLTVPKRLSEAGIKTGARHGGDLWLLPKNILLSSRMIGHGRKSRFLRMTKLPMIRCVVTVGSCGAHRAGKGFLPVQRMSPNRHRLCPPTSQKEPTLNILVLQSS